MTSARVRVLTDSERGQRRCSYPHCGEQPVCVYRTSTWRHSCLGHLIREHLNIAIDLDLVHLVGPDGALLNSLIHYTRASEQAS